MKNFNINLLIIMMTLLQVKKVLSFCEEDPLKLNTQGRKRQLCDSIVEFQYIQDDKNQSFLTFDIQFERLVGQSWNQIDYPQFILFATKERQTNPLEFIQIQINNGQQIDNQQDDLIDLDYNRFFKERSYLKVTIQKDKSFQTGQSIYFYLIDLHLVLGQEQKLNLQQISYSFHLESIDEFHCLNNCNNYGSCQQFQCACVEGQFDLDCNISGESLTTEENERQYYIEQQTSKYFFLDIQRQKQIQSGQLQLDFISSKSFTISQYMPNERDGQLRNKLSECKQQFNEKIGQNYTAVIDQNSQEMSTITVIVYKIVAIDGDIQLVVKLTQINTNSSKNLMMISICIATGSFLFLVLILLTIKLFQRSKKKQTAQQQVGQEQPNNQIPPVSNPLNQILKRKESSFFTKSEINNLLPQIVYNHKIKQKYQSGDQCSVCLEDFVIERDLIRITICKHVFHTNCLDLWIQAHQNCPLCRQQHSLADMKQFCRNNEKQNKISSILINPHQQISIEDTSFLSAKDRIRRNSQQLTNIIISPRLSIKGSPNNNNNNNNQITNNKVYSLPQIFSNRIAQDISLVEQNKKQLEFLQRRQNFIFESIPPIMIQSQSERGILNQNKQIMNRPFPLNIQIIKLQNTLTKSRTDDNIHQAQNIKIIII